MMQTKELLFVLSVSNCAFVHFSMDQWYDDQSKDHRTQMAPTYFPVRLTALTST